MNITAVTFRPEAAEMQALESVLGGLADIRCLAGIESAGRLAALKAADIVISKSFSRKEVGLADVSALECVRLIQLVFAGAEQVPYEALPENVMVAGNAGAFAAPLAEHVLGMVLCLAKKILNGHEALARGRFESSVFSRELRGCTCAIVGMGGNGAAIASLMKGVGMRVMGINRSGKSTASLDFMGTLADMDRVLQVADVVVLTVPLTRTTRGMIGRDELRCMKPDAILINVARGAVVEQQALYDHLTAVPTFSAGIDTWWSETGDPRGFKVDYPFFDLPDVIGSPHKADHVPAMRAKAVGAAAENVRDFLEGKPVRGIVDRTDYFHRCMPNMAT